MQNINREHPEYVARKAMWKQYKDLYAGGERLRASASEYLVRRHKEPGEVYRERLSRVFYENYIGSIIDWYAATLMRREPMVMFEGNDPAAKSFYSLLAGRLRPEGNEPARVLPAAIHAGAGVRQQLRGGGFSASEAGAALTRAEEDASGRSRAYLVDYGADEVINWNYDPNGRAGVGGDPDVVPAAVEGHGREVGAGDAVDLLRPRELPDLPEGQANRARSSWWTRGGTGWRRCGGCRCSEWKCSEGLWLMNKAALLQLEHFNKSNALSWALTMGLFATPVVYSDREWNQVVGESYYIQLGPGDRFGWTEPEGKVYQIAADNLVAAEGRDLPGVLPR